MVNSPINRWLAMSSQVVPIGMKNKLPVHIIVFELVTCDGDIIPLFICPHGPRLNTEA